eukprot:TRINITY_DN6592_c0_g1_i1.p1 TRINITY_DN6592_c0_g1~~TRINITY_DN6592_c0_g1_i1.p1  ORF type:complete len:398 (+),score=61.42 TRINITY_DN6592_c0_g1_i1:62-1195(+)
MSRNALARQVRNWSMGMDHQVVSERSTINWRHRKDAKRDGEMSVTSKSDEATIGLFGNDPVGPWVHPIKDVSHSGKIDNERKTLWEEAMYTQRPNLMNDQTHINAERIPSAVGGSHPMVRNKQDPFPNARFVGMYPETHSDHPGNHWKNINSQTLYSHMLFQQSKAAESERFGGEFGLPQDDYPTQNGVLPLFSAEKFRNLKYRVHEPIVRNLNKLTDGGKTTIKDILSLSLDNEKLAAAAEHSAWCTFWSSMYPRGGVLRDEFKAILEKDFGCLDQFHLEMVKGASDIYSKGGGSVWVVLNSNKKLEVIPMLSGPNHPYQENCKIIANMIVTKDTVNGYDSAAEYSQRFLSVFDYDFAYASYCSATGVVAPNPLVF